MRGPSSTIHMGPIMILCILKDWLVCIQRLSSNKADCQLTKTYMQRNKKAPTVSQQEVRIFMLLERRLLKYCQMALNSNLIR